MIEMSVDKETVTTRNTKVETIPPLQPQQLSECTGSCNNAPKMPEVTLANPDNADGAATCPMPANAAQTKHTSSGDTHNETENVGQQASVSEDHLNPKNGLQQQQHHQQHQQHQQQQQQQQQKLTKRRSTMNVGFKHPQSGKRRRRANSESDSVLPTNFLLGGNIFDPLNLNSLLDEEVNKALNAETPKSSPLPAKSRDPVEILIPRDITDPLNLNSGVADSSLLVSPLKSGGRRRHRNRHHGGGGGGGGAGGVSASQFDLLESERGSEVNNSSSSLPKLTLGSSASVSLLEGPRVSSTQSSVTVDSQGCNEINSSICKDEAILPVSAPQAQPRGPEDSSTTTAGGLNQLSTRQRKRRRNSGKTEPPLAHCTNVAKPGTEDSGQGTGAGRHTQSFHTPVSGRAGTGSRQQQPHNQHRQQPHQHKQKFQYGNYNKYYGYRNPGCSEDPRLHVLRPEWFRGKAVLDLGCNTGHLTLCIAKKLRPARILGLDIDGGLVHAARQNIRHYLSEVQTQEARLGTGEEEGEKPNSQEKERKGDEMHSGRETQRERQKMDKQCEGELRAENGNAEKLVKGGSAPTEAVDDNRSSRHKGGKGQDRGAKEMEKRDSGMPAVDHLASCSFPVSLRVSRGPIAAPPLPETPLMPPGNFPSNVSFVKGNYVLESDALLLTQRPEYDVILCFSVTKWVHLNWGDTGLKRLFHRVYRHLRPGGRFILEPQQWPTYSRRKNLTDSISKNYQSIRLKPDEFSTYLTSEVGFSSYELIGIPTSSSRGFQRPIYLFHK